MSDVVIVVSPFAQGVIVGGILAFGVMLGCSYWDFRKW